MVGGGGCEVHGQLDGEEPAIHRDVLSIRGSGPISHHQRKDILDCPLAGEVAHAGMKGPAMRTSEQQRGRCLPAGHGEGRRLHVPSRTTRAPYDAHVQPGAERQAVWHINHALPVCPYSKTNRVPSGMQMSTAGATLPRESHG